MNTSSISKKQSSEITRVNQFPPAELVTKSVETRVNQFRRMVMWLRDLNSSIIRCRTVKNYNYTKELGTPEAWELAELMGCGHYCFRNVTGCNTFPSRDKCCVCADTRENCRHPHFTLAIPLGWQPLIRSECACSEDKKIRFPRRVCNKCYCSVCSTDEMVPDVIEWTPKTHNDLYPYIQLLVTAIMSIKGLPQDILYIIAHLYIQTLVNKVLVTFKDMGKKQMWNNFNSHHI